MVLWAAVALPSFAQDARPPSFPVTVKLTRGFSNSNTGFWDLPGSDPEYKPGAVLQIYTLGKKVYKDRLFEFEASQKYPGSYHIRPKNGGSVGFSKDDLKSGGKATTSGPLDTERKCFTLEYEGRGRWKIHPLADKSLVLVPQGGKYEDGTDLVLAKDKNDPTVEWYFLDPKTGKVYEP